MQRVGIDNGKERWPLRKFNEELVALGMTYEVGGSKETEYLDDSCVGISEKIDHPQAQTESKERTALLLNATDALGPSTRRSEPKGRYDAAFEFAAVLRI